MKEANKAFFFEKKKQKTFTPLSPGGDESRGLRVGGAVAVGMVALLLAYAFAFGFSDTKLYLALYFLLTSGVLNLLNRRTYNQSLHAKLKQAIGLPLLCVVVLSILLKARVGFTPSYTSILVLPAYFIASFGVRPIWLKKEKRLSEADRQSK